LATIDANEKRDVMSAIIPNALVRTDMAVYGDDKMMMKIHVPLVDILIALDSEHYTPFVVQEFLLNLELLKAPDGTFQAAFVFYMTLKKDLESNGIKVNANQAA
jgi:hypothetical protein